MTKQDIADKATEIFSKYKGEKELHYIDNGNFWTGTNKGYGVQYANSLGFELRTITKEQLDNYNKEIADKIKADKSKVVLMDKT